MRTDYCRQHIKKAAEECDLGPDIVAEVESVDMFCKSHTAFADCATRPIMVLLRIKDEPVKDLAISLAENALNERTPTGGKRYKRLTEPEIKKIIHKAKLEVRSKLPDMIEQGEIQVLACPQSGIVPVTDSPVAIPISHDDAFVLQVQTALKEQQQHSNPQTASTLPVSPVAVQESPTSSIDKEQIAKELVALMSDDDQATLKKIVAAKNLTGYVAAIHLAIVWAKREVCR